MAKGSISQDLIFIQYIIMKYDNNLFFSTLASCRVVLGASICAVYDLQNGTVHTYPLWVGEFVNSYDGTRSIGHIIDDAIYSELEVETLLSEFYEKKFIILTRHPELFRVVEVSEPEASFTVENAIVDFDEDTDMNQHVIFLKELSKNRCKAVDLRFYSYKSIKKVSKVVALVVRSEIDIVNVYINIPSDKLEHDVSVLVKIPSIDAIYCFTKDCKGLGSRFKGVYLVEGSLSVNSCGVVNPSSFKTDIKSFYANSRFNECLKGKVGLDARGNVKNCPSQKKDFGKFGSTGFKALLASDAFNEMQRIVKDQVQVCKDCVYRYCCTDCRVFLSDPENMFSKPLKCGYDPYTNTWSEKEGDFLSLKIR